MGSLVPMAPLTNRLAGPGQKGHAGGVADISPGSATTGSATPGNRPQKYIRPGRSGGPPAIRRQSSAANCSEPSGFASGHPAGMPAIRRQSSAANCSDPGFASGHPAGMPAISRGLS
ncbi:MAG: hypothetical protein LV479_05805, partial [Methylacidiphilales bacterium]|nr:hypothetical protein [Candidatus Methylacidiphilales bacterium]